MKQLIALLVASSLALFASQTLDIDFSKNVPSSVCGKKIDFAVKDGFLPVGTKDYELPAAQLVGKQGTILVKFRQNKPTGGKETNRAPFTLRCNSRMTVNLYICHDSISFFRYAFGDKDAQIYQQINPQYDFGKDYWEGLSWDGRTVQFFHEGKLYATCKQPIEMEKLRSLYLGTYSDGWNGLAPWPDDTLISSIKVYNHALTPVEVAKTCQVQLIPSVKKYPGKLTVPLLPSQQVSVNGELQEQLWKTAASLPVLSSDIAKQTYLAPEGRFLMSADNKNLYLAMEYIFPAGNTVAAGAARKPGIEPEVWGTESFELYFLIGNDWYRFGGNVAGGYTEFKNNGSDWNGKWNYASQMRMQIDNTNLWQAEASIPWSTLGLNAPPTSPIKFNFCRTWVLPDYSSATSIVHNATYQKKELYFDLCFSKNAATVRKLTGNDPSRGLFLQKVSITSPVAGKVTYEVASSDSTGASNPVPVISKELTLQAGETVECDLNGRITSAAYDQLRYTLYNGKEVLARCTTPYQLNEVLLDVNPRFINGYLEVNVPLDLLQLRYGENAKLQLALLAPDGKMLSSTPVTASKTNIPFNNKMAEGEYKIRILKDKSETISELELNFPGIGSWFNGDKDFPQDIILPPFTPMNTTTNSFSIWGRTYTYGKSLFPEQITTQDSKCFAAAPQLIANGKAVAGSSFNIGKTAAHHSDFTATAANDDCSVTETGWVEYDGLSYSKFSLKATSTLNDVKLRFTLPEEMAKYMHAVLGGSWYSKITRPVTEGDFNCGFYPMLWIGREDKGICLFTETSLNWTFPKNRALHINKSNGLVTVEFTLREKLNAGETFDFEFGYLASPVKPLPSHYPCNATGDTHCIPMQRPGSNTFVGYAITVSTPYPHEIDDFFAEFPTEEKSTTTKHLKRLIELAHNYGKKAKIYMDGRYLTDEYPEVAAFKDEWRTLPQRTLNYKKDGVTHIIYDTCPTTAANNFYCLHLKRLIERFKPDGIYYDFGTIGVCNNKLHGCNQRWAFLGYREFLRRTYLLLYNSGVKEPIVALHNTDYVQLPCYTFATLLLNGEHIRQHSSTIMHNGKDIQDTYNIEMFANELSSLPFGITNSVYQANDVLRPEFGGGKEDPELYKFRITQAFLAGVLPHNTMLSQARCHYGILEKVSRALDDFGVNNSSFIGYWEKPATVNGSNNIYVSVHLAKDRKSALAIISHIGKDHDIHNFNVTFDAKKLGFTPTKAKDIMVQNDPLYQELYKIRQKNNVPNDRAPLKLGDWGSTLHSCCNGTISMSLKYHTFAIVELK